MRPVVWTPAARRDLFDIGVWRGREYPERGEAILSVIVAACDRLGRFPELGPAIPQIAPEARRPSVERYLVLYALTADTVEIVRVVDQRRDLRAVDFGKP